MSKTKSPNKEENAHSEFGPSSAERYVNCAGSVDLARRSPKSPDTDFSKEGTEAHSVFESFLRSGKEKVGLTESFLLKSYPREMVLHGRKAATYIWGVAAKHAGAEIFPEEKVDISHFTKPEEKGTLDCAIVVEFDTLYIFDYKYGAGVFVPVVENLQLIAYALAVAKRFDYNFSRVVLGVIQPRCPDENGKTERQWETTIDNLISYEKVFLDAIKAAEDPLAPYHYGDWCRFCPGKPTCPEISIQALAQAKIDFAEDDGVISVPVPTSVGIKNLATIYPALEKLEMWIEAVKEHALHAVKQGAKIPGYKLVNKTGRRQWTDPKAAKKMGMKIFGKQILSEPELLSPNQAEIALKGDYNNEAVKKFVSKHTSTVSSGVTIVPESDKRTAVDLMQESFPDALEAPEEPKSVSKKKNKKGKKK